MTPAWLLDAVAAIMLAVAAVSAARLAAARPWRRGAVVIDTDGVSRTIRANRPGLPSEYVMVDV
jgi:hypothetical protein